MISWFCTQVFVGPRLLPVRLLMKADTDVNNHRPITDRSPVLYSKSFIPNIPSSSQLVKNGLVSPLVPSDLTLIVPDVVQNLWCFWRSVWLFLGNGSTSAMIVGGVPSPPLSLDFLSVCVCVILSHTRSKKPEFLTSAC